MKVGFLGMGVMGLPMAKNLVKKAGCEILGFDVVEKQREAFAAAGGTAVSDAEEIYKTCDVIMQILPTHAIIRDSVEKAIRFGKPGRIIVDLSSTAPDIIQEITDHETVRQALRSIKENERRIVLERIIEEKSFGQLSDELGMSYKTVASLYYRAIKKLRRFMEEGESK